MLKRFLETGQITSTHGVRGEVRVQPWCDSPEFLTRFSTLYLDADGTRTLMVQKARVHGNVAVLKIKGIDTIEQAQCYRGKTLYMERSDAVLPEGHYYVQDLIGCRVFDADTNVTYGCISDVSKTGANDVWHIQDESGKEFLIPSIPDVVISVDVEQEKVMIRPLKGIFDDEN